MLIHYWLDIPLHLNFLWHFTLWCPSGTSVYIPSGNNGPIAYVRQALPSVENYYSQLDNEALAIVYRSKKCPNYVCARALTTWTHHKPLLGLSGQVKPIPNQTSRGFSRWVILMQAYPYYLRFWLEEPYQNAGCLIRLWCELSVGNVMPPRENILLMYVLDRAVLLVQGT